MDRIELRFDACAHHVRKCDAKRAAKHEVRKDAQGRQKNAKTEKKNGQCEPFDTAEIGCDFRLRGRVDRLKKSFAENSVIDDRPINEPTEARRAVDLAAPFGRAGRAKEDQVLETQERFGFAVTFLLLKKRAQGEAAVMPDHRGRAKTDHATGLLKTPAKIDIVARLMVLDVETADVLKCPAIERH